MAMLFLVLFSTLAVGFYTATAMDAKIAGNDSKIVQARDAADGGMRFMRYQLGNISLPAVIPSGIMDALVTKLGGQLNGTPAMGNYTVQNSGGTIYIPAQNQWMTLDSSTGSWFNAAITQSGTSLVVTVTGAGKTTSLTRAIQLTFQQTPLSGNVFNYGIASASEITMGGNVKITGSPSTAGTPPPRAASRPGRT